MDYNSSPQAPQTVWELFQLLSLQGARPEPCVPENMTVGPLHSYLQQLFETLANHVSIREVTSKQEWRSYTGLRRQMDLETVLLPELLRSLSFFAETGDLDCGWRAAAALLEALARESVRQGVVPVRIKTDGLGKSNAVQPLSDEDTCTPSTTVVEFDSGDVELGEFSFKPPSVQ